jgi:hypothetical protein
MRSDKLKRHIHFAQIIENLIRDAQPENTVKFEGALWARLPQSAWCELLNVSAPTLRGLAKHLPVVSTKTNGENGKPVVLYRLGDEPHYSPRHIANKMAKIFRDKHELQRMSSWDWGCLYGLAEVWPAGHQVEIFRTAIENWSDFMGGVGLYETDDDQEMYDGRFYKYPVVKIIRKYPRVGLDLHILKLQWAGISPDPSLVRASQKFD